MKDEITVNTVKSELTAPHWGVTLRTLFGAALDAWPEGKPGDRREFKVIMKDKEIATIQVQKHPL